MFTAAFVLLFGLLFVGVKLPRRYILVALHYGAVVDVVASILLYVLHWGTYSGLMAAAAAGMMCSVVTTVARKLFGEIDDGKYKRGFIKINPQMKSSTPKSLNQDKKALAQAKLAAVRAAIQERQKSSQ